MIPVNLCTVTVTCMCALAATASADILNTNIGGGDNSSTLIGQGSSTVYKAVGFNIPTSETYRLDSVTLQLTMNGGTPEVSIWTGAGTPQVQIATLNNPPLAGTGNFTFTAPPGGIELTGGTFWVYVRSPDNIGSFSWIATTIDPLGAIPFAGYIFNGNSSSFRNKVQTDGVFARQCVNFDFLPGNDGRLGTADDITFTAPTLFSAASPLSNEFASVSLGFRPSDGSIDNRNEVLDGASFGPNPGSPPNILATSVSTGGIIEIEFSRDVYEVTCILGISGSVNDDRLAAFDASGNLLDSADGFRSGVTLSSSTPIRILRGTALSGGTTVTLDDLCYSFVPSTPSCAADLSSSSDPNDPGYGVPDGSLDASDFFYYLDQFVGGNLAVADLSGSSDPNDPGYGIPDGTLDASDFFFYLDIFVAGCP